MFVAPPDLSKCQTSTTCGQPDASFIESLIFAEPGQAGLWIIRDVSFYRIGFIVDNFVLTCLSLSGDETTFMNTLVRLHSILFYFC